jgi:hypothetical protein
MANERTARLRPDELDRIPPRDLDLLECLLERPQDRKLRVRVDRLVRRNPHYERLLEFMGGVDRLIQGVMAYQDDSLLPNLPAPDEARPVPRALVARPADLIGQFLDSARVGAPKRAGNLTLWPLLRAQTVASEPSPRFTLLCDALESDDVVVSEVDAEGSVPHLRLLNRGRLPLLVLFGEQLIGAKQNRVSNATFLIPPWQELVIDVSCVEKGRWSARAAAPRRAVRTAASASLLSQRIRRSMASSIRYSLGASRGFHADQANVWAQVSDSLASESVRSPTSSYSEYVASLAPRLEQIRDAIPPSRDQLGFVAAINDELVGLEAIGAASAFTRMYPSLLDAYATDALYARERARRRALQPSADPSAFIARVRKASTTSAPSLGLGVDVRISGDQLEGCALVTDGLVHLTASPAGEPA